MRVSLGMVMETVALPRPFPARSRQWIDSQRRGLSALATYRARQPLRMGGSAEWAYLTPGLPIETVSDEELGASALLKGENAGLAIDFTGNNGLGYVTVKGHTTNLFNVPVDSFLTNSGTSPKLVRNAAGTYVWSPHNLCLRSDAFDFGAPWQKLGTPTLTSGVADPLGGTSAYTMAATGANDSLYQGVTAITGAPYTSSIWIRRRTGTGTIRVIPPDNAGNQAVVITSAWQQFPITSAGTNPAYVGVQIATSGDAIDIWHAQVNRGTVPTTYMATTTAARFGVPMEYDAGWYALVEPAATNILTRSREFDNAAWTKSGTSISANSTAGPDGTTVADTLIEDGSTGIHQVYQGQSVAGAAVFTGSVFLKKKDRRYVGVAVAENSGSPKRYGIVVDLDTGLITATDSTNTPVGASGVVRTLGNGWYRAELTLTNSGATGNCFIAIAASNSATPTFSFSLPTYAGDNASGTYISDAQLETGSVATSPIPTFAATVTRAADTIGVAATAYPQSATANTMISHFMPLGPSGADYGVWELYQSGTNLAYQSAYNRTLYVSTGGVVVADRSPAGDLQNTWSKKAAAWAQDDFAAVVNGGTPSTDSSGAMPTTPTELRVGWSAAGGNTRLNGKLRSLVYLPRRMPNADLQLRTAA